MHVGADPLALRHLASSLDTSAGRLEAAIRHLEAVETPPAPQASARLVQEVAELRAMRQLLLARAMLFAEADVAIARHHRLVPMTAPRFRLPNPAREMIERAVDRLRRRIETLIAEAKKAARPYRDIAAKAKKGVFYGNFAGKENRDLQGDAYGRREARLTFRSIEVDTYLPGGKTKRIEWGFEHRAVDPLDLCAAKHDARYGELGIGAESQFSVKGLAKSAATNLAMANCAAGVFADPLFDKDRVDPKSGVRAEHAAKGVVALFGAMGGIGAAIANSAHAIARAVPGVDFHEALGFIDRFAGATISAGVATIDAVDLVVP